MARQLAYFLHIYIWWHVVFYIDWWTRNKIEKSKRIENFLIRNLLETLISVSHASMRHIIRYFRCDLRTFNQRAYYFLKGRQRTRCCSCSTNFMWTSHVLLYSEIGFWFLTSTVPIWSTELKAEYKRTLTPLQQRNVNVSLAFIFQWFILMHWSCHTPENSLW